MSASIHSYSRREKQHSGFADRWLADDLSSSPLVVHNLSRSAASGNDSLYGSPVYRYHHRNASVSRRTPVTPSSIGFYSPFSVRRTHTTSLFPATHMTNLPNLTQREPKGSSSQGLMDTSYRDSCQPWLRRDHVFDRTGAAGRLYQTSTSSRAAREYSTKPLSVDRTSNPSNPVVGLSNRLTALSINGPCLPVNVKTNRTLNADSVVSNLSSDTTSSAHGSSSSISLTSSSTRPGVGLKFTSAHFPSVASRPIIQSPTVHDSSPPPPACRSPGPPVSVGSSNSSNNSSDPRWSTTSRLAPPGGFVTVKTVAIEDQRNGGLVGLNNLGNTCFMNSIIQCLSNTHPLSDYCLSGRYMSDLNKSSTMRGNLFASYVSLMKELWDPELLDSSVSPHQFRMQMQRFAPRFVGYAQQDSQEFLRYVLEGLHMEVNRVTKKPPPVTPDYATEDKLADCEKAAIYWRRYLSMDNSEIVDLFVGQLMSTLECAECTFKSTTFDPFWDLSLPIPKKSNVNIMDCLRLFTSKEDLDGNERPVCGRCKIRRRCAKSFSIHKFPRILVLRLCISDLKRFSGERFRSKMSILVDYPITDLDLSEFASSSCQQRRAIYNLYAVSNHSGSVYAGHYTATCKHHFRDTWFEYNDSRVHSTSTQSVVSPEGYVLFYELVD
ncbi:ubiquitin carboxyl-terminal hydrolase 2 [Paragonimus westermani]|uniref:Ubiquitin carboxyl-terminal hydrolase n=1 Tax=Paragonimus westermani TaxID=34504 RepID=A0A5J4NF64_9TREM|nr:ubiquitin carboxyl-terminal hydrolase 2 [Paragonimus westermani]